jgi:hypothetical protein
VLRAVQAFGWVGVVTFRALIAGIVLLFMAIVTRRTLDFSKGWWPARGRQQEGSARNQHGILFERIVDYSD